jgi:hypothetical protein
VNSQKLLIRTSDLTVGTKVNFDLVDQSGLILLKAGGVFTQEVREELQRRGIETVTVFVRRRTEARSENEVLVSSYDAQGIKRIEQGFAASETAIRSCVQEIQSGRSPDSNALRRQLDALKDKSTERRAIPATGRASCAILMAFNGDGDPYAMEFV